MLAKLVSAAGIAIMLLVGTGAAVSAATESSALSGFEIAATGTQGQFVGTVTGGPLAGSFYANVYHQELTTTTSAICGVGESSSSVSPCSSKTLFSTVTVYLDSGGRVLGEFAYASGGISNTADPSGACSGPLFSTTLQTYKVTDTVAFVHNIGTYSFQVTLTHYKINLPSFLGGCTSYFATISGEMTASGS